MNIEKKLTNQQKKTKQIKQTNKQTNKQNTFPKELSMIFGSNYARVKGDLEPTHLKSSPLFTFLTKLLGQDSPSVHLFSITIGSRFTATKIKLGEDSPR